MACSELAVPLVHRAKQTTVLYLQLDGSTDPGLYPIEAMHRTWNLDKGRPKTMLGVQQWQLPLVPAFAITALSSQGKTLPLAPNVPLHNEKTSAFTLQAVMLDLNVSK